VVFASFFLVQAKPQQSWIAGILGFWLIIVAIAPFLVSGIGIYLNNIIVGLIITVIGLEILVHGEKLIRHVKKIEEHISYRNYGSE
jgi:cobalamin biosynthesis protein CobD/CbiB